MTEAADALLSLSAQFAEKEAECEGLRQDAERLRKELLRYGCPYVSHVASLENGHERLHQIISATPTPNGLRVVIAAIAARKP